MDDEWITEDAALAWLRQTYKLPPAVAENQLVDAFRSGNVPARDRITRVIEDSPGNFRGELIPQRLGVLGLCHEQVYRFEELRWQTEQQLGKQKPPRGASTNQQPAQDTLNARLLDFANTRGQKIKQSDSDACDILKEMGATTRQIPKAFRSLPKEYSFQRGSPGKANV